MYFMNSRVIEEDMQDIYERRIGWEKLKDKTVLVTGATGMLASYVVYFLFYLNQYHFMNIQIILFVRNTEKAQRRFGNYLLQEHCKLYTIDINKPWELSEKIDYIIHTAGLANPQLYIKIPVQVAEPNVIGLYYLLCFAHRKKVKKVLFFSSGDVYGRMPDGVEAIRENMMGITDPLDEHSCYGESKRMGETWCRLFYKEYGVPTVIARIGHTYGPTMDIDKDPRVFASFMKCIYEGKDIEMFSSGSAKRPFCYIADAVVAYFILLFKGVAGEAYNVCNTNEFISVLELANILIGLRPELNLQVIRKLRREHDQYMDNRINHDNRPIEDKLKNLGWKCSYDVRKGFSRVLRYLLENFKMNNIKSLS